MARYCVVIYHSICYRWIAILMHFYTPIELNINNVNIHKRLLFLRINEPLHRNSSKLYYDIAAVYFYTFESLNPWTDEVLSTIVEMSNLYHWKTYIPPSLPSPPLLPPPFSASPTLWRSSVVWVVETQQNPKKKKILKQIYFKVYLLRPKTVPYVAHR